VDANGAAAFARSGGKMSRVAGAYSRAGGQDPTVELFNDTDARGDALSEFDRAVAAVAHDHVTQFESVDDGQAALLNATPSLARPAPPLHGRPAAESVFSAMPPRVRARNDTVQRNLSGLVERVFLPVSGEPTRSLAFVSIGKDADSGPLAAAAAEMLAERTSRTVCVVDAHFRAPSLHRRFELANAGGFAEALASDTPLDEAARRLQRNLWVIPAGVASAPPLFSTAAARQRISQLVAQFDHVIFDVDPVPPGGDIAALLRLLGGVIVVIAADSTRRETARRAKQTLTESGITVIGAVLTNRRFPIPDALFRLL
jgi:Mrp family chromosome partitioning ATPase